MISITQEDLNCWKGFLSLLKRSSALKQSFDHRFTVFLSYLLEDSETADVESSLLREAINNIKHDLVDAGAVVYDDSDSIDRVKESDVAILFCTPAYCRATEERSGTKYPVQNGLLHQVKQARLPIIPIWWSGAFLQAVPEPWQKYYMPNASFIACYKATWIALWSIINQCLSLQAPLSYHEHCFVVMILPQLSRKQQATIRMRDALLRALHFFSRDLEQNRIQIIMVLRALGDFYDYDRHPQALNLFRRALQLSMALPPNLEGHIRLQYRMFEAWALTLLGQNMQRFEQSLPNITEITRRFIVLYWKEHKQDRLADITYLHLRTMLTFYAFLIRKTKKDLSGSITTCLENLDEETFGSTHPMRIIPLVNAANNYYSPDDPQGLILLNKALEIATVRADASKTFLPTILARKSDHLLARAKSENPERRNDYHRQARILLQSALAIESSQVGSEDSSLAPILISLINSYLVSPLLYIQEIIVLTQHLFLIYTARKRYQFLIERAELIGNLLLSWQLPEFAKAFVYYALDVINRSAVNAPKELQQARSRAEAIFETAVHQSGGSYEYIRAKMQQQQAQQSEMDETTHNKAWSTLTISPFSEYAQRDGGNLLSNFSAFLECFLSAPSNSAKKMRNELYVSLPKHFNPKILEGFADSLAEIGWKINICTNSPADSAGNEKESIKRSCAAIVIVTEETPTDQGQQTCIDSILQANACAAFPIMPILYTGDKKDIPEKLRSFLSVTQHLWLQNYDNFLSFYIKQLLHLAVRCGLVSHLLNVDKKSIIDPALIPLIVLLASALSASNENVIMENTMQLALLAFTAINFQDNQILCPTSTLIHLLLILQKCNLFSEYAQCRSWVQGRLNPKQSPRDAKLWVQIFMASNNIGARLSVSVLSNIFMSAQFRVTKITVKNNSKAANNLPHNVLRLEVAPKQESTILESYAIAEQEIGRIVLTQGTTGDELIFWLDSLAKLLPLKNFPPQDIRLAEQQLWHLMLIVVMHHAASQVEQILNCCKKLAHACVMRGDFVTATAVMQSCTAVLQKYASTEKTAIQISIEIVRALERLADNWIGIEDLFFSLRQLMLQARTQMPSLRISSDLRLLPVQAMPYQVQATPKLLSVISMLKRDFSSLTIRQVQSCIETLIKADLFAIAYPYVLKLETALDTLPEQREHAALRQRTQEYLAILALQAGDVARAITLLKAIQAQDNILTQRITDCELIAQSKFLQPESCSLEKINQLYNQNQNHLLSLEAMTDSIMKADCSLFEQQVFLSLLLCVLNDEEKSKGLKFLLTWVSALQPQKENAANTSLLLPLYIVIAQEYGKNQQPQEQEKHLLLALQLCADDQRTDWRINVRLSLALANAKEQQNAFQEAAEKVEEAVDQVKKHDPKDFALLKLYKRWISLLSILEDSNTVIILWRAILALCENILSINWIQQAECYQHLASLYEASKDWPNAIDMWKKYLALINKHIATDGDLQNAYQWSILIAESALNYAQKQQAEVNSQAENASNDLFKPQQKP